MTFVISKSWRSNSGSEDSEKGGDGTSLPSQGRGRIMNKISKRVTAIVFRGSDMHLKRSEML